MEMVDLCVHLTCYHKASLDTQQGPTMSIQTAWQHTFAFFDKPVLVETLLAQLSKDAGLLPFRQFDQQVRLTEAFAAVLDDPRDPDFIEYSFLDMPRLRVFGILADYEDQNDHDTLRHDPIFKLLGLLNAGAVVADASV